MSVFLSHDPKELGEALELLHGLTRHRGWALLKEHFQGFAQAEQHAALKTDNAVVMAKRLGSAAAILDILGWPDRQAEATALALKDLQESGH